MTGTGGTAAPSQVVLVVDFGAQYAQLIARRVRELNVYSEIVAPTITAAQIEARAPAAIILSGGPASVHVEDAPRLDPGIYRLGIPILGICYGCQLIAHQLGGIVGRNARGEYGRTTLEPSPALPSSVLPDGERRTVWMSHFDGVTTLPDGFVATATTEGSPVAVLEDDARRIWGVQFHPEVVHTEGGTEMLARFLDLAGCDRSWTMASIIDSSVAAIRHQVGDGRAICGLSGGVDSAVAAALVHRAIGHRLTCVYVDTGLMRLGESEQVVDTFRRHQGMELIHARAGDRFFDRLAGVTDPEVKRKAIGELFIRVFEEASGGVSDATFLVQGTLYPDVIESGTATAAKIKSHHNVGGLPDDLQFELVEPLRNLFKDEVRQVGAELGLPDEIVWRQPFPGPGLGVRIVGEVTPERVAVLQQADAIVRAEIDRAGLTREIWQAFAVLADIRSVGVMGDERTYAHPIIIRAVTSDDAMTADWGPAPRRVAGPDVESDHQRGRRDQPRRLRHHVQAARHDRVGVTSSAPVAVVTGAGAGIGFEIGRRLTERGASVVLNDVDRDAADRAAARVAATGGSVAVVAGDASDPDVIDELCETAVSRFGRLDAAVANAGITTFGSFLTYPVEQFQRLVTVNLQGSFFLAQRAATRIIEQGAGGRILLLSSVTGFRHHPDLVAYGMSKAAIRMLARSLGVELAPHGITVNAIAPGATVTERTAEDDRYEATWSALTPTGRPATVADIANAALFLLSPDAGHITGQTLVVDGGWTAVSPPPS